MSKYAPHPRSAFSHIPLTSHLTLEGKHGEAFRWAARLRAETDPPPELEITRNTPHPRSACAHIPLGGYRPASYLNLTRADRELLADRPVQHLSGFAAWRARHEWVRRHCAQIDPLVFSLVRALKRHAPQWPKRSERLYA